MSNDFVIITGHVQVPADERDAHVERMQDLVRRARQFDGCVHIAVTVDLVDPTRVNNAEVWGPRSPRSVAPARERAGAA